MSKSNKIFEILFSAILLVRLSNCASFSLTYTEKAHCTGVRSGSFTCSLTGSFNTCLHV